MNGATELIKIKGVGEKTAAALAARGLRTVDDMLTLFPRRYDEYTETTRIVDLQPGNVVIRAHCEQIQTRRVRRGMSLTEATLSDESGKVRAVWFNQPYREGQLKSGAAFLFAGEFQFRAGRYQLINPSVEKATEVEHKQGDALVPIYPATKDVPSRVLHKIIQQILPAVPFLEETLPAEIVQEERLLSYADAIRLMHNPKTSQDVAMARERLGFEELFEMLLASQLNKKEQTKLQGWKISFDQRVVKDFVEKLPFQLTNAQRRAAWQILQDFGSTSPMNRLLQGDVGSGKTVVAGLAATQAASAGFQTAIMAPTEVLATQHAKTLEKMLAPLGVRVALLTGTLTERQRRPLLDSLQDGEIDVVIGTHALIQSTVAYKKLGFVVIDEQHRFGVKQRQALLEKSVRMPHLLSVSATPIPRSLALTLYGELDISVLDELPPGRQKIKTEIWSPASAMRLYEMIAAEIDSGRQAYVICSLIDNNQNNDKKSVESEYYRLKRTVFGKYRLGMLHGKMKPEKKDAVMQAFAVGEIDILVSTTVVEVGVNVPNATVMLIENAEAFGLSQLHQLRGRVGRGTHQSYCFLMMGTHDKPSQRLREIEKSQDGFYLAEVDLKLRGPGEIYGRAQHGALNLKIATLADTKLIQRAQIQAKRFVKEEKNLLQYKHLAEKVKHYQRITTLN